jgi:hypothetical protein
MSNIAHLDTTALDTAAKFFRVMQKAGANFTGPMQSTTKRSNLVEYLKLGCPKVSTNSVVGSPALPIGAELARLILGDDFISPEEVYSAYGWQYTDEHSAHLAETIPDFGTLVWLRTNGFILVAGPYTDLNLFGVRDFDATLFYRKDDDDVWFEKEKYAFARIDRVRGGEWLALRKNAVPNSMALRLWDQTSLVQSPERIPNVAEVVYGGTVYFKVRGDYLLPNISVRTSSVDADGDRVLVGYAGKERGYVENFFNNHFHHNLGIASAYTLR